MRHSPPQPFHCELQYLTWTLAMKPSAHWSPPLLSRISSEYWLARSRLSRDILLLCVSCFQIIDGMVAKNPIIPSQEVSLEMPGGQKHVPGVLLFFPSPYPGLSFIPRPSEDSLTRKNSGFFFSSRAPITATIGFVGLDHVKLSLKSGSLKGSFFRKMEETCMKQM